MEKKFLHESAAREIHEETGLSEFKFLVNNKEQIPIPIDVDIHLIPANSKEPSHYHYDIRFAVISSEKKIKDFRRIKGFTLGFF